MTYLLNITVTTLLDTLTGKILFKSKLSNEITAINTIWKFANTICITQFDLLNYIHLILRGLGITKIS